MRYIGCNAWKVLQIKIWLVCCCACKCNGSLNGSAEGVQQAWRVNSNELRKGIALHCIRTEQKLQMQYYWNLALQLHLKFHVAANVQAKEISNDTQNFL